METFKRRIYYTIIGEGMIKLDELFNSSVAKILDQVQVFGNMEQTISMLSESTGLSYKTVQSALEKMEEQGIVYKTRKIGNAQAFKFDTEKLKHLLKFLIENDEEAKKLVEGLKK